MLTVLSLPSFPHKSKSSSFNSCRVLWLCARSLPAPIIMTSKKHRPNLVVCSLESALPVSVAMGSSNASSAIPQEKSSSWKDAFRPSSRPRSGSEDSKSRGWTSPLRRKKKDRKATCTRSATSSPVSGSHEEEMCSSSSSSTNNPFEATPENSLPGGRPVAASTVSRDSDIPTILVSPEEDDDQHMWRKLSQGSSTMTSGGHYNSEPAGSSPPLSLACDSFLSLSLFKAFLTIACHIYTVIPSTLSLSFLKAFLTIV